MNTPITLLRDRAAYTPEEKALIQGIIDGGLNTIDILLNLNKIEAGCILGMRPEKVPMLEEILLREGYYLGMSEAELDFAKMRVLTRDEKGIYIFPDPIGLE